MNNIRSPFGTLALVSGIALSVIGAVMFMASRPMSESAAINNAVRVTVSADGKKMNQITRAERHQALQRREVTNAARAGRRSTGGALTGGGIALLVAGGIACKGRQPNVAQQV